MSSLTPPVQAVLDSSAFRKPRGAAERLQLVYAIGIEITSIQDMDVLFEWAIRRITDWLGYTHASIALVEGDRLVFQASMNRGVFKYRPKKWYPQHQRFSIKVGEHLSGHVAETGETLVVGDVSKDPRFLKVEDGDIQSEIAVPIKRGSTVLGVLNLESTQLNDFTEEDQKLLELLAGQIAVAIENVRLFEQIQQRTSELQRFRAALDSSADAIFLIDRADMRFIDANETACASVGYSRDELLRMGPHDIKPHYTREMLAARFDEIISGSVNTGVIKTVHRRKDGSEFPVEVFLRPMESDGSTILIASARDLTERKQAEEAFIRQMQELARSNAELEQFAYVASHDLQEPLRMVSNYTQLLARRYQGKLDADADRFIQHAVDGAKRMQTLVNDLLVFSRVGTRGKPFEPTDCTTVAETVIANLHAPIADADAVVTYDPLPTVMADASQLVSLFQNLISNAIKFHGDAPPRVHISAEHQDSAWVFAVRDNGIGIEPEYFDRIFLIFQRLHTRKEYPGTGIGLALCKKIVERHGGRVWVESELGQGATFFFTIPDQGDSRS